MARATETNIEALRTHLACRVPIIYIHSWEEVRVERTLRELARRGLDPPRPLSVWSCTEGLKQEGKEIEGTHDPLRFLDHLLTEGEGGLFLAKDLPAFFEGNPHLVRRLRDFAARAKFAGQTLLLLSPRLMLPEDLQKDVAIVEFTLPTLAEIGDLFDLLVEERRATGRFEVTLSPKQREQFLSAALGLTLAEAEKAFLRAMLGKDRLTIADVAAVIAEKTKFIKTSTALEFIPHTVRFRDLGGLDRLKKWAKERAVGFTEQGRSAGLPRPKGVLVTGISGCGKSLTIKALAHLWHLPLVRLDFTRVYAGEFGTPEETLRRALRTVEAIAPALLWIDEIEMGFAGAEGGRETTSVRVFSHFLTWMQEKRAPVFVGATANDIERLPAELLRKGRFDEIFYVDLPTPQEREEIFRIHLENRNNEVAVATLQGLARQTEGWSGAEIEECIVAAMYRATAQGRKLTIEDLFFTIGSSVPLSVTMDDQIKKSKRWADKRARKASRSATRI